MALNFQYNKTSLQSLEKQLKVRVRSLPTIKSKESALRMEVKKAKSESERLELELETKIKGFETMIALWDEFDTSLLSVKDVRMSTKKIAGVNTPVLDGVDFEIKPFSFFNKPTWYMDGMTQIKNLAQIGIECKFFEQKMLLLDYSRKKTTQKVNLFEKIQIPGYQEAIRKIKRFMEDEENLSKAGQKIVKTRQEKRKVENDDN